MKSNQGLAVPVNALHFEHTADENISGSIPDVLIMAKRTG
jgi:hypothetical protein